MTSTPQCVIQLLPLKVPRPVDISVTVKTELQRKDKEREKLWLNTMHYELDAVMYT